jgi:polyhydroxyalkanoate synthase subunit PhaC
MPATERTPPIPFPEAERTLAAPTPDMPADGDADGHSEAIDRLLHAWAARSTGGLSPVALAQAYFDWAAHLAASPGKQSELVAKAVRKAARYALYVGDLARSPDTASCIVPLAQDDRFRDPAWRQWPFNAISQSFLLAQQWWYNATTGLRGVSKHHEQVVEFGARQWLDLFSPSNFPWTNPEVMAAALSQGGANFWRGGELWVRDVERALSGRPPAGAERFRPGLEVAATPGEVIHRNRLMELIQYRPATDTVHAEPVLILPAWIMKYYILDLSPGNSLVRYLVERGHTVYIVSWKNPGSAERDVSFDDYRRLGLMAALDVIRALQPCARVHAAGYCLGGTMLSIGAAAMAAAGDDRIAGVTLFAAQTDFTEPGELSLFIDDSQLALLEDAMWDRGYLGGDSMAGAFQLLRSRDLIWSRMVREYLLGEDAPLTDLMAWNADTTRLPYRMHSEYLRELFLHNDLAEGRMRVDERPVALSDIRAPAFVVATETDHVAPWRSVYKIHLLTDTAVTFCLASGGHNAGIVSEPGHPRRHYRIDTRVRGGRYAAPEAWFGAHGPRDGSWWPAWQAWLAAASTPGAAPPPSSAADGGIGPLCPAPGTYVLER